MIHTGCPNIKKSKRQKSREILWLLCKQDHHCDLAENMQLLEFDNFLVKSKQIRSPFILTNFFLMLFIHLQHQSNSMKSDSGGEMESCRSSDSELERELHEKEKEILERDRELTNCYRTLAERDTDLIKVRLECQRLLEDNRQLRSQLNDLKTLGFSGGNNSKRQIEMEKEIENLKWHLSIVSSIIVGVRKEVLK